MHKQKERLITLITAIIIAIVSLPLLCFGLGNNDGVNTAWTFSPSVNTSTGNYRGDSVIYSLSGSASDAYVYIGNVYVAPSDKIELTLITSNSLDSLKKDDYLPTAKKVCTINAKKGEYLGWVKLDFKGTLTSKYLKITTEQSFEFFEVGFTTLKGEVVTAECVGGIVWENGTQKFITAEAQENTFALTCDESNAFNPKKGIFSLTDREIALSGAINNLINFKGGYVFENANPLGVALTSLGVLIFGNGPFGLRVVGFLFFVATLYLLLFAAKKLFGGVKYGIIAVVLYIFAGLGLSLVTKSAIETISAFFVLASFNFAGQFYLTVKDGKSARMNSNKLLVSGLCYSLAISISAYSLFILPALLLVCLYPGIKAILETRKTYTTSSGLEKEYAREKYNATLSSVVLKSVLAFIVMPIILVIVSYGIGFATYNTFYATNLFGAIYHDYAKVFSAFNDGLFLGWIIGLGSSAMPTVHGYNLYIIANRVLTAVACLSVAVTGVLYILNRFNKLLNGKLIVALKEHFKVYVLILAGFLSTWLLNIFTVNHGNYASFVITLIFAILSLTLLYKVLSQSVKKWVVNSVTIAVATLAIICLVLELPYLFNFDLSKDLQVIYNWLV